MVLINGVIGFIPQVSLDHGPISTGRMNPNLAIPLPARHH